VKPPAGTIWAKVIEASGSARDDKLSHDAAALRACPYIIAARRTAHDPPVTILIAPPPKFSRDHHGTYGLTQEFVVFRRLTTIQIERTLHAEPPTVQFGRVDHRRAYVRVTEEFLHRPDV
jgi:hypothetical protein